MTDSQRPDHPGKPREHTREGTCWCEPRGAMPCPECDGSKKGKCFRCDEHGLVDAPIPSEVTTWVHRESSDRHGKDTLR